ncbi:hypothetical protein FA95DRAFT_442192 [Auriscalpium vulgare]|uniref:Uncharacterized protein n=1 Tax=Auriscalpium vulgare TaxID=40419 RepID=A0ACB8RHN1_9AGAM|nr:hypothetical protein FA95DRAFT_442192 [Auriscalpium vulgare]
MSRAQCLLVRAVRDYTSQFSPSVCEYVLSHLTLASIMGSKPHDGRPGAVFGVAVAALHERCSPRRLMTAAKEDLLDSEKLIKQHGPLFNEDQRDAIEQRLINAQALRGRLPENLGLTALPKVWRYRKAVKQVLFTAEVLPNCTDLLCD